MSNYTRRTLLKHGTTLAALGSMGTVVSPFTERGRLQAQSAIEPSIPLIDDPKVKELCDIALNAATEAGARFADIRLTHTFARNFNYSSVSNTESMSMGVRTLVEGFWGFASSPIWTPDEAARLARAAVENAKANLIGKPRTVELAPVQPIENGRWIAPITDDAFLMSEDEIIDYFTGLRKFMEKLRKVNYASAGGTFLKQDKVFASTANQFFTQRKYVTWGSIGFSISGSGSRYKQVGLSSVSAAGLGFEHLRHKNIRRDVLELHEEVTKDLELPLKQVDVGRYAMVFDAATTAQFVHSTIGKATELDRALGEEANADGTSYIIDPVAMLDTLKIGSPLLNVTANRNEVGGAATVRWDDEGEQPQEFSLVKDGMLKEMQVNREGAGWLKDEYIKRNLPLTSRGCADTQDAIYAPITRCANLQLQSADNDATFDSLIEGIGKGIAVKRGRAGLDFQQMTGYAAGDAFEVKDGKRVAEIEDAAILFRTTELWSALTAVGGRASARRIGIASRKGQPVQQAVISVTTPPIAIKELSMIDKKRKA